MGLKPLQPIKKHGSAAFKGLSPEYLCRLPLGFEIETLRLLPIQHLEEVLSKYSSIPPNHQAQHRSAAIDTEI